MWDNVWLGRLGHLGAVIFLWMVWDFFKVNMKYGEDVLLSSREGVDELLPDTDKPGE